MMTSTMISGHPALVYADHAPAPALAPWVASYWSVVMAGVTPDGSLSVPPDGCTHLAFGGGDRVLVGPQVTPFRVPARPGLRWFGVRFWPGAARPFLRLPDTQPLRGLALPAAMVPALDWVPELGARLGGTDAADVAAADLVLGPLAAAAARPEPALWGAVQRILLAAGSGPSVRQLADGAGMSERHFRRRFRRATDLSPKELARIWRLRRCAEAAAREAGESGENWAARAADHGFADQSHLAREFQKLMGEAPGAFGRRTATILHRRVWSPEAGPAAGTIPTRAPLRP